MLAMTSSGISLGQTPVHSPMLVQLPKPSAFICATMLRARRVALGLALRQDVEVRDLGAGEEHGRGVRAGGHAGAAADAGGGVHGAVGDRPCATRMALPSGALPVETRDVAAGLR